MATVLAGQAKSLVHVYLNQTERQRHWDILSRAFELYLEIGEREKAVELAKLPIPFGGVKGTFGLIGRALRLVPEDSEDAGWLSARLGVALMDEQGDLPAAHRALDRAYAIGQNHNNLALQARALAHRTQILSAQDRHEEGITQGLAAIEAARRAGDPWSEIRIFLDHAMIAGGDPLSAASVERTHLALASRLRAPQIQLGTLATLCLVARLTGDWPQMRALRVEREDLGAPPAEQAVLAAIESCDLGPVMDGVGALEVALDRFIAEGWGRQGFLFATAPCILAATARAHGGETALSTAREAAEQILAYPPPLPRPARVAEHVLGFIAVARRDVAAAGHLYESILPRRGHADPHGGFSIDRLLGLLAATRGDREAALPHFEDALAFCRKAGYRPEIAWTCHDCAETLLGAGGGLDRQKVASLLSEGSEIASELGMAPLAGKLETLQQRLAARQGGRPAYPDGLTEREVEVLRLITAGRSNAEIADALVITPNTAAKHVANILLKINAANRAEAASYAHQHGLIQPSADSTRAAQGRGYP